MDVRHPLAGLAAVIEIEHRGHRIDPEAVDMIAVEPEQRIRLRGNSQLPAGRNCRSAYSSPCGSRASDPHARRARCRRSEQARAGRSENAPAPSRSRRRYRCHGSGRRSAQTRSDRRTARWGQTSRWLIAPRAGKRMLADRQQFDMGEAEIAHIRNELIGKPVVIEEAIAFTAPPGAEMHLVDGDRRGAILQAGPRGDPVAIIPVMRDEPVYARGGRRAALRRQNPTGSDFNGKLRSVDTDDLVFVEGAACERSE